MSEPSNSPNSSHTLPNYVVKIMQSANVEEVYQYEMKKLAETIADEGERTLMSWQSRWRREALEHYAKSGWSFVIRDAEDDEEHEEGALAGYFLAQPLLFFDGQTQTLWVEHIQYSTLKGRDLLVDVAYRLARDKHFQRVLFIKENAIENSLSAIKAEPWGTAVAVARTSKSISS